MHILHHVPIWSLLSCNWKMISLISVKLNSSHFNIEFTSMLAVNLTINKYMTIILVHFIVCSFHSLRATNYLDLFLLRAQNKKFTLASHVVQCLLVLPSKLIGTEVFAFNPYFCIKYIPFPQELNIDSSWVLNKKVDFRLISKKEIFSHVYFSDFNL